LGVAPCRPSRVWGLAQHLEVAPCRPSRVWRLAQHLEVAPCRPSRVWRLAQHLGVAPCRPSRVGVLGEPHAVLWGDGRVGPWGGFERLWLREGRGEDSSPGSELDTEGPDSAGSRLETRWSPGRVGLSFLRVWVTRFEVILWCLDVFMKALNPLTWG